MDEQQIPIEGHKYVFGLDYGSEYDPGYVAIADATTEQIIGIRRYNHIGWAVTRTYLLSLNDVWQPAAIWAETNSIGAVNLEALQAEGLPMRPFTVTARSKQVLMEGLLSAIQQNKLVFPSNESLWRELRLPLTPGVFNDSAIAIALSWHGVRYSGAGIDFA